jgi:hypothetical protein
VSGRRGNRVVGFGTGREGREVLGQGEEGCEWGRWGLGGGTWGRTERKGSEGSDEFGTPGGGFSQPRQLQPLFEFNE